MSGFAEYDNYDAVGLADLVRRKEARPDELFEEALSRIQDRNPSLNAIITPMFDEARSAIEKGLPEASFTGVPFLLKDLLAAYAGVRFASGSRAFKDYVPDYDSELTRRFKAAGLSIMGKTNTPEFGLVGVTEPELFGPSRNPWDRQRTPGGSSGGSAAAVAAGMVPMASGGDGGGSIRIPASFCGLFGLKPTRMRTPSGPRLGRIWHGLAIEHVLTRSVRDSAAMLDAIHGPDPGAPFAAPPPPRPYLEEIGRDPGPLKIAFSADSPYGTEVDPECRQAAEKTALLLESLGHKVSEAKPSLDGLALANSYFTLYFGEIAADIAAARQITGRKPTRRDFETLTWFFGKLGDKATARTFTEGIRKWDEAAREMGRFHLNYDIFLTPTVAAPPAKVGELKPRPYEEIGMKALSLLGLEGLVLKGRLLESIALPILARTPFTQLANFTGQPAMSVPLFEHSNGLPLGVQFIAPFGDESTLFRLASQLESARPWFDRRPALKLS